MKTKIPLQKWKSFPNNGGNNSFKGGSFKGSRSKKWAKEMYSDILHLDGSPLPKLPEEEEAVGIITMEDVIEELLQVLYLYIAFLNLYPVTCLSHISKKSLVLALINGQEEYFSRTVHCRFFLQCRRRSLMRQITILRIHDSGLNWWWVTVGMNTTDDDEIFSFIYISQPLGPLYWISWDSWVVRTYVDLFLYLDQAICLQWQKCNEEDICLFCIFYKVELHSCKFQFDDCCMSTD